MRGIVSPKALNYKQDNSFWIPVYLSGMLIYYCVDEKRYILQNGYRKLLSKKIISLTKPTIV